MDRYTWVVRITFCLHRPSRVAKDLFTYFCNKEGKIFDLKIKKEERSGYKGPPRAIIILCEGPLNYEHVSVYRKYFTIFSSFLHDVTEQNKMVRLHGDGAITYGKF